VRADGGGFAAGYVGRIVVGQDERRAAIGRYLLCAERAAREQPYAGVLPDTAPPMAQVWVPQQVRRLVPGQADGHPRDSAETRDPALEILARGGSCVVLAGPGGGKSSLLRALLTDAVDRWRTGAEAAAVPVLVPARSLVVPRAPVLPLGRFPLPEKLAQAATAELREFGLTEALPTSFFSDPPRPGVPWLVLVDGLDEITDRNHRWQVLHTLSRAVRGTHSAQYRIVLATRPLDSDKFLDLHAEAPIWELQPFTAEDLLHLARRWFAALDQADPDGAAQRFTRMATRTQLNELARVPLVATMLCQLHAARPDEPLPATRGAVYRQFAELLCRRLRDAGPDGIRAQHRAMVERWSSDVLVSAEDLLTRLPELLARHAAAHHAQRVGSLHIRNSLHPGFSAAVEPPPGVRKTEWQHWVGEVLKSSGLLTGHADRTLLEYFAARHATRDEAARVRTFRALFPQPVRHWPGAYAPGVPSRRWGRRYWSPPYHADAFSPPTPSYVGFLLDIGDGQDDPATVLTLERLAGRGGVDGCRFIVAQARLRTRLPDSVVRAVLVTLDRFARGHDLNGDEGFDPREAVRSLADLADPRADDVLDLLARDTHLPQWLRSEAIHSLATRGDHRWV